MGHAKKGFIVDLKFTFNRCPAFPAAKSDTSAHGAFPLPQAQQTHPRAEGRLCAGGAAGVWASLWGPGVVAVSGQLTEVTGAGWPVIWWEPQRLFS